MSILKSTNAGRYRPLTVDYLISAGWTCPKIKIGNELFDGRRWFRNDNSKHKHFLESLYPYSTFTMRLVIECQEYRFYIQTLNDVAFVEAVWNSTNQEENTTAKKNLLANLKHECRKRGSWV